MNQNEAVPIGIVACSAEGAALCYRTIIHESSALLGENVHPEVSLHTMPFDRYVTCLDDGDLEGVADLMLTSAHKLAGAGAGLLVCPDNTIHAAWPYLAAKAPLPWLHIAEVVAAEASRRGFRRLGLLGTHWLVASDVYPPVLEAAGIDCVRAPEPDRVETGRVIMEEFVQGRFEQPAIDYLRHLIDGFAQAGCDGVILGCTELPLVLNDDNAAVPTLDSTRLLARDAVRESQERAAAAPV
ncbi:MAG: amino acid racemase [Pseudomonadota bacterium]